MSIGSTLHFTLNIYNITQNNSQEIIYTVCFLTIVNYGVLAWMEKGMAPKSDEVKTAPTIRHIPCNFY